VAYIGLQSLISIVGRSSKYRLTENIYVTRELQNKQLAYCRLIGHLTVTEHYGQSNDTNIFPHAIIGWLSENYNCLIMQCEYNLYYNNSGRNDRGSIVREGQKSRPTCRYYLLCTHSQYTVLIKQLINQVKLK